MFPRHKWQRYLLSTAGILLVLSAVCVWWSRRGTAEVLAYYAGPLLVVNAWLSGVTWLQHTDVHTPHLDDEAWTWVRGAFCSIDRPYHWLLDWLHHRIGSTNVAHHVFPTIPHYHAQEATRALRAAFPEYCRVDPTPVPQALWRIARTCGLVHPRGDGTFWHRTGPVPPVTGVSSSTVAHHRR